MAGEKPAGEKKARTKTVIEIAGSGGAADPVAASMTAPVLPVAAASPSGSAVPADAAAAAAEAHVAAPDLPAGGTDRVDPPAAASAATDEAADAGPAIPAAPVPTTDASVPRRFVPESTYPTPSAAAAPEQTLKDLTMADTFTTAADAMKNGAEQMKSTMASQTESAMATGKATMDQVATKSREALEHGMKSVDDMAGLARGNVEAMLASSRTAASGIEAIARQVADFSRKSFEETTAAARAMTTVKTPNELMQLQNDFAKTQFDAAVAEMSKLSETMVKLMGEVFQPLQERATVATDKIKSAVGQVGQ